MPVARTRVTAAAREAAEDPPAPARDASTAVPRRPVGRSLTEAQWGLPLPAAPQEAYDASVHVVRKVWRDLRGKGRPLQHDEPTYVEARTDGYAPDDRRAAPEEHYQHVRTGQRLRYVEWSAGDRGAQQITVVMIHGIAESVGVWQRVAPRVAEAEGRARVIALDLRGHGRSTTPRDHDYSIDALVADLEDFCLELDLYTQPIMLVGQDLGAAVALTYAARFPRLVGALVLLEYSHEMDTDRMLYHKLQAAKWQTAPDVVNFFNWQGWRDGPKRTTGQTMSYLTHLMHLDDKGRWCFMMDSRFYFDHKPRQLLHALQEVRCHLQVVYGDRSHWVTELLAGRVAKKAQHAREPRVEAIGNCTHWVLGDAPEEFLDVVIDTLKRARPCLLGQEEHASARLPETLSLKPLPEYDTVEAAAKALAPRPVPTREAVEAALAELRTEDESASDEEDGSHRFVQDWRSAFVPVR